MAFKLGNETRGFKNSKNTNIVRKNLEDGILGEANNDGSINIDTSVKPGSAKEKEIVTHEQVHMQDMESGKLAYGDHWIRWNNKTYPRKEGEIKYNGKWYEEGAKNLPWEKAAYKKSGKHKTV